MGAGVVDCGALWVDVGETRACGLRSGAMAGQLVARRAGSEGDQGQRQALEAMETRAERKPNQTGPPIETESHVYPFPLQHLFWCHFAWTVIYAYVTIGA